MKINNHGNLKIIQIKVQTKGLLQGLFPSLSETGISGLKDEQDEKNNHGNLKITQIKVQTKGLFLNVNEVTE